MPIGVPRCRRMSMQIELPPPSAGIRPVVICIHRDAPGGAWAPCFRPEDMCASATRSPLNTPLLQNHGKRPALLEGTLPRSFRQWMFGLARRIPAPLLPPGMSSAMNGRMLRRMPFDVSRNDEILYRSGLCMVGLVGIGYTGVGNERLTTRRGERTLRNDWLWSMRELHGGG